MKGQVNFKRFWKLTLSVMALTVLGLFLLGGSNCNGILICQDKHFSGHHLSDHPFDPQSTLIERIKPIPEPILKKLKKSDNKKDYTPYMPNQNEIVVISAAFEDLPQLNMKITKERLAAIYFISNFTSAGYSDWLVNEHNEIYAYIVINSSVLKTSIDELLSWKEKSCFINTNSDFEIKISVSPDLKGFMYIILHESCHVVDYVLGITPFTEPGIKSLREIPEETDFTRGIWRSYNQSVIYYKFRERASFYQTPRIKISEAENIYKDMSASPFISLYGSLNWAEDLCEFLTFYHLTEKMGMRYKIEIQQNGKTIHSVHPAQRAQVRKRFKSLRVFY